MAIYNLIKCMQKTITWINILYIQLDLTIASLANTSTAVTIQHFRVLIVFLIKKTMIQLCTQMTLLVSFYCRQSCEWDSQTAKKKSHERNRSLNRNRYQCCAIQKCYVKTVADRPLENDTGKLQYHPIYVSLSQRKVTNDHYLRFFIMNKSTGRTTLHQFLRK